MLQITSISKTWCDHNTGIGRHNQNADNLTNKQNEWQNIIIMSFERLRNRIECDRWMHAGNSRFH